MGRNFVGWIEGKLQDKRKLRKLGVKGRMKYNLNLRCFEHCEIDEDIVDNLRKEHPPFWSPAFTGVSLNGSQEFLNFKV